MHNETRNSEAEYEMAVHVAVAFSHVKEAQAWAADGFPLMPELNVAERTLRRVWASLSEENRRLVDLSAYHHAGELRS